MDMEPAGRLGPARAPLPRDEQIALAAINILNQGLGSLVTTLERLNEQAAELQERLAKERQERFAKEAELQERFAKEAAERNEKFLQLMNNLLERK
jgi:predicted ATP-grasp superfamily ATP-dependent carboligase